MTQMKWPPANPGRFKMMSSALHKLEVAANDNGPESLKASHILKVLYKKSVFNDDNDNDNND